MAAPVNKTKFMQDINAPIKAVYGGGLMFSKGNLSNVISVDIVDDGQPFEVTGTVVGKVIRSDGTTIPVNTGAISGNTVSLTLTEACFDVPGQIVVNIIVTNGDVKCCILRAVYTVVPTETDAVVDPGDILPSIAHLIDDIDAAVASIPADYSGLLASIADTFSPSTAYAASAYVWYDGTLYRFNAAHAAGSWTGSDATAVTIGGELADIQNAITLENTAEGIIQADGGSGSYSDSSLSVVKTGNIIKIHGKYTASARRRFKLSGAFANGTSTASAWYANTILTLSGDKPFAVEPIEIGGSAHFSTGDTGYSLAIFVYDTSGNIVMSAYLYATGWRKSVISTSNANIGAVVLTVNKNYEFDNYEISYRLISDIAGQNAVYVDGVSGNDAQIGTKTSPLKTIGKAISIGYRKICAKPGTYNEKINLTGGEFELIPWVDDQAYDGSSAPFRPRIKLINGTKLTVSATGTTGIYQASYTAASGTNIYKVFVDHSVNPTTSGSLALEYNAMLVGDMPNTSTASKAFSPYRQRLFTPVLTEGELSSEGTFWYDDTNHLIKFHALNETADGEYYVPADDSDNIISLQSMDRVHMEDVKALGCYGNCIYINKCSDVELNACEAGYSGKGMGIKLDYTNARVSDCHAYAVSVDGFNLHGYGYSEIVGCTAYYCGDDGISHHEGCSGFIDGGEWAYNGSGGITPSFGSQIDVRNASAHHNSVGIQWLGKSDQCRYTKMCNCLAVDNTTDIYCKWYVVEAWNNIFRTKDSPYSSARSNLIEYGTIIPE